MILHDTSLKAARRAPTVADTLADPEGHITSLSEMRARAATTLLVKRIGDLLETNFPGWGWAISPDERGGVITIRSLRLDARYGYLLHTQKIQDDPQLKAVLRAGGEILERCGMKRGAYSYENWKNAKRYMGQVAYDMSDKDAKMRRRYRDEAFSQAVRTGKIQLRVEDTKTANGTYRQLYVGDVNGS